MGLYLVTGATGFVGSWLTRRLYQEGHAVRVLCRDEKGLDEDLREKCEIVIGDITSLKNLTQATKGVERVYHLAGLVAYSEDQRQAMEEVNVGGTKNVLSACHENSVPELVYMSSVVAIGADKKPKVLNEMSPFEISDLDLGYFETKRVAEELVMKAHQAGTIKAFILNPSTIYGPGDFKKGSRKIQLKVARGKFPFYTNGGVSIVSIHDVVEACMKVTEKGSPGERYILSGDNISIRQLFEKIASETNVKPPQTLLPTFIVRFLGKIGVLSRESSYTSTMYHWFDNTKAKEELGIQFKSADEAIRESVKWLKEHPNEV